jgi:hypothetical protein
MKVIITKSHGEDAISAQSEDGSLAWFCGSPSVPAAPAEIPSESELAARNERERQAREYNNAFNEGGYGYNP